MIAYQTTSLPCLNDCINFIFLVERVKKKSELKSIIFIGVKMVN